MKTNGLRRLLLATGLLALAVVLYRDINRDEALRTYEYTSKRDIKPGRNAVLRGGDLAYPTVDFVYPYEGEVVEVTYADGSVWSRP